MPDLNELLRWSIANSTKPTESEPDTQSTSAQSSQASQPLSLRFNPATTPSSGTSALHPSDPLYRVGNTDDASPASTPGPLTPEAGVSSLPQQRPDLNTDILDIIMGKSDSVTMKEKLGYAVDETNGVESRIEALDDFEMLIELIDNANNMTALRLWEPLLRLLQSPEDGIVAHTCWIIGTAVQNNLKAQAAFFLHNALPLILDIIRPTSSSSRTRPTSTRARATYALSSALKHWPLASSVLASSSDQGYSVLASSAADKEPVIRRKTAFLIHTLVLQSDEKYEGEIPKEVQALLEERMEETAAGASSESLVDGLKRTKVFEALISSLSGVGGESDVEFEENAVRALGQAAAKGGFKAEDKERVRGIYESWGSDGQEERGLSGADGQEIARLLA